MVLYPVLMNILMLTYEIIDEGGNFIRCYSLAKQLVAFGHKVTILASNKHLSLISQRSVRQGVTIIEVGCPLPRRIRHNGASPFQIFGRILYLLRNHDFDVVHGFGHRPAVSVPSFFFGLIYRKPYIADWADLWGWGGLASDRGGIVGTAIGFFDDILEKTVYRAASRLTVICTSLKQKASRLGIPKSRISVVPPGASADEIVPLLKTAARKSLGFPSRAYVLVYIGNAPYDARLLAETVAEVLKREKHAMAIVVGRPMAEFEEIITEYNLDSRVRRFGFISHENLEKFMASGDVMLLPYTNRTINTNRYPNKLGDYLASGRPIVANPTGDLATVFATHHIGDFAPENPVKFAQVVLRLLHNSKRMSVLGRNARRLAEREFSWKRRAETLCGVYTEACLEKTSGLIPREAA